MTPGERCDEIMRLIDDTLAAVGALQADRPARRAPQEPVTNASASDLASVGARRKLKGGSTRQIAGTAI